MSFCHSCPAASSSGCRATCATAIGGGGDADTTRRLLRRRLRLRFAAKRKRDARMIPHVQNALRYYNARHPGGEFDAVKPLMQTRVWFRGQHWLHINFLARSRSSNKIKRFFAELHYKPLLNISGFVSLEQLPDPLPVPVAIVETCTIIEEPLDRYRRSCAFCPGQFDILHPMSDRKFVCGNDKDRFYQKLTHCNQLQFDLPFM
uniref:DUF3615 domain-containing protein n=1 Tax=Oryza punctata TaxID=4537 RepID=A0A0E0LIS9_ORYPU